jgi:glycosyltransferase involved in cell wall biosynthesis
MYDIIFDFSSSPIGGSLRRLLAFTIFFTKSDLKVKFLIHPSAVQIVKDVDCQSYEIVHKTILDKIFFSTGYLKKYKKRTKWFFSYGIPIKNKIGIKNWLHISNVLPISQKKISTGLINKLKILLQRFYFKKYSINPDIVSGESTFTLNEYEMLVGKISSFLLPNGITPINIDNINCTMEFIHGKNYAVAVGTASYKRIDKTFQLFREIKDKNSLGMLIIVGHKNNVSKALQRRADIHIVSDLSDEEYFRLLKNARVFISTSEIENSSCAVLEAALYVKTCYLSIIPSHMEMMNEEFYIERYSDDVFKLEKRNEVDKLISYYSWNDTIRKMLNIMNF